MKVNTTNLSESAESFIQMVESLSNSYYDNLKETEEDTTTQDESSSVVGDFIQSVSNNMFIERIKKNRAEILIGIYTAFLQLFVLLQVRLILHTIYYLKPIEVKLHYRAMIVIIISVLIFIWSTKYKFWSFHRQKLYLFSLCISCYTLFTITLLLDNVLFFIIPLLKNIYPINITVNMIHFLGQYLTTLFLSICTYVFIRFLYRTFYNKIALEQLLSFHISLYIDERKNKKNLYDLKIIQKMDTGKPYTIQEHDRTTHVVINGTSGTGKTSSTMEVQILNDLDKKQSNLKHLKKELIKMLKNDQVYINQPFTDKDFSTTYFTPKNQYKDKYYELLRKYMNCGLTLVAPNEGLTDEIYEYCENKNIVCNRIDPILDPTTNKKKKGSKGFNPFLISPIVPKTEIDLEIVKKASVFADVLQTLNELKGKGDQYFTGVNRSVTTSLVILLLKTYHMVHPGKQCNPTHFQYLLNDFRRVQEYYRKFTMLSTAEKEHYQFVIDFISNDILGAGAEKMYDHARGLRNLVNEFLSNPLIRDVLTDDDSVDLYKMLSEGQITVFNYALQLGNTDSIGFGLLFTLSFNDAVLKRPGTSKTRIPHIYDIDEFPVLLHPSFERNFTLFRQYWVSMVVAIQSLDQMDKSEQTKYLKGVLMGCAHHIIFGRCSTSEMQIYSELAGTELSYVTSESNSQTSLSTDAPSFSYSSRTTVEEVNILDKTKIRNRLFQEVTVFSVKSGNVLKPFFGKVDFVPKYRFKKEKVVDIDWLKYYLKSKENNPNIKISSDDYISNFNKLNDLNLNTVATVSTRSSDIQKKEINEPENELQNYQAEEEEDDDNGISI